MLKIIMNGCNGKMGQVVSRIVAEQEDIEIVAGIDVSDRITNTYPTYAKLGDFAGSADVLIDFSIPDSLESILEFTAARNMPAVICTTGLNRAQIDSMHTASAKIPIFFSANMSLGVNLIIDLAKRAAKLLEGSFDIEIVEKHHNQKIDAPSGTALAIADRISEVLADTPEYVYDRHSSREKRSKTEIGIHAIRGGTIVGEHDIIFAGTDEVITLSHSAASKEVFAVGAVKAARFMYGKPAGMYSMAELVGE